MIDERIALNLDDMKRAAEEAITFVAGVQSRISWSHLSDKKPVPCA